VNSMHEDEPVKSAAVFRTTQWTRVLEARGDSTEARAALSDLCAVYYTPVFRFLRREGRDEDAARELTQEFFARILERGEIGAADPARGRFRTYLLGAVKHFLADQRDHAARKKRGGGQTSESLDADRDGEGQLQIADTTGELRDTFFDREWALALMDRALKEVSAEFTRDGKAKQFDALKPWLVGDAGKLSQADVVRELGWSESAVKVGVHRLRKRFRETIRDEIAQTVADGTDIDGELRYLVEVLAQG
jgi:RNA polymerase sigma factor (sigma-70 family)